MISHEEHRLKVNEKFWTIKRQGKKEEMKSIIIILNKLAEFKAGVTGYGNQ